MIITTQQLKEQYNNYSNPITKIGRDIRQGKLFPLVKGVYETNPNTHGSRISQFIMVHLICRLIIFYIIKN